MSIDPIVDVIIYHNPDCGTSRNVLGLIRNVADRAHRQGVGRMLYQDLFATLRRD